MKTLGKAKRLGALTLAGFLAMAGSTQAQEIRLTSSDGTVNMTGDFVAFEDNSYVIATALGELRVSAARVSCEGAACPNLSQGDVDFKIAGSDEIATGMMPLLLEGYAGSKDAAAEIGNTGQNGQLVAKLIGDQGFGDDLATVEVTGSSATEGFQSLLSGDSEIVMATRRIQPEEARALSADGAGNMVDPQQEHIIAVDSLVVITHPDNQIPALDVRQLFGIYSGAVSNWSQVGGPDLPVQVVIARISDDRSDSFEGSFFGSADIRITPNAQIVDSSNQVPQAVNSNPGAIGVVSYAFQRGANAVKVINQCGLVEQPDAFSAKTEEYSLQRRLFLYTRGDTLSAQGKDFVDYAASAEADGVIRKAGFIGFNVDRREQNIEDPRSQVLLQPGIDNFETNLKREMLSQMLEYDRLSTTFRFRTGSAQLDERGIVDRDRLVDYLEDQPAGTEVVLVGFTDEVGRFESNLDLSKRRSAEVTDQLLAFADNRLSNIQFSSAGYGEIAPSGCNATENGRRINRRVEVWIKSPA